MGFLGLLLCKKSWRWLCVCVCVNVCVHTRFLVTPMVQIPLRPTSVHVITKVICRALYLLITFWQVATSASFLYSKASETGGVRQIELSWHRLPILIRTLRSEDASVLLFSVFCWQLFSADRKAHHAVTIQRLPGACQCLGGWAWLCHSWSFCWCGLIFMALPVIVVIRPWRCINVTWLRGAAVSSPAHWASKQ